eukprot:7388495-Prymnesium_polylepis.1
MFPMGNDQSGTTWVSNHADIIRHYLQGWFTIDLVSVLSSSFDIWALYDEQPSAESGGGARSGVSSFKTLRVVRAMRLLKLMRLLRASRIYKRWEASTAVNYSRERR